MADHIPFVNGITDYETFRAHYRDSCMVRIPLEKINEIKNQPPKNTPLWIDPGIDGYEHYLSGREPWAPWSNYIAQFKENMLLATADSVKNPDKEKLKLFVRNVLDKCNEFSPKWITVPQLPIAEGNSRNRVNRALARAAYEWKVAKGFGGEFVLPLIFTHQRQVRIKTNWMPKLQVARKCCTDAQARLVWVVDSSLYDQDGSGTFPKRFAALVSFHEDLRRLFPKESIIAGPYWGMNLVLWARSLCEHPAVSLGTGYQYRLSGSALWSKGKRKSRIALAPLRRRAVMGAKLRGWLELVLNSLNPKYEAYKQLLRLSKNTQSLQERGASRRQTAEFYKKWFDGIQQVPPAARALTLYQDLSLAYVLGKQLPPLPKSKGSGTDPSIVAQQLMLNCL
jgi:hypothetical protein